MKNLEQKREDIAERLKQAERLSFEGFIVSDIGLGIFIALFSASVCLFIPVLGWIALPFVLLICPFMATSARQKQYAKAAEKLEKELNRIDKAIERA